MSRKTFDLELENLHNDLIRMGSIVEKQIYYCIEALIKQDEEIANTVIKNDDLVDDMQKDIEDKCIKLIAMQQPLAKDLRIIFTAIKIASDLERIADYALDIAKVEKKLKNERYIKDIDNIPKMADLVKEMIKKSLDAYINGDVEESYNICKIDDDVDLIYKQIFEEMIHVMIEDKDKITQATQLLLIARYLERLGDHITNICESTIYMVTGKQVDLNE